MQTEIRPSEGELALPRSGVRSANVRPSERLASTVAGGALTLYALRNDDAVSIPALLAGGYLIYRGTSGYCPLYQRLGINSADAALRPVHVEHSLTISASQEELYRFWRNLANLPVFMRHLKEVQIIDDTHSHWIAQGPAGSEVSWDAEIIEERAPELIAWRSLPDAQITNAGMVRFAPAPGGRGTEIRVMLNYLPPAGKIGQAVARLLGEEPRQQVSDDMRRLKMFLEAGEVANNAMRPQSKRQEVA